MRQPCPKAHVESNRGTMNEKPNVGIAAKRGWPSRLQSPRLVAAVAELGSLGHFTRA
jgi:hypothetical protein